MGMLPIIAAQMAMNNNGRGSRPRGITCPHCKNFVPYADGSSWEDVKAVIIVICVVLVFIYGCVVMTEWLFVPDRNDTTLADVFREQWHWLKSIRVW